MAFAIRTFLYFLSLTSLRLTFLASDLIFSPSLDECGMRNADIIVEVLLILLSKLSSFSCPTMVHFLVDVILPLSPVFTHCMEDLHPLANISWYPF